MEKFIRKEFRTALCVFAFCMMLISPIYGDQYAFGAVKRRQVDITEMKITLRSSGKPITHVLREVGQKTGIFFAYEDQLDKEITSVSVDVDDKPVIELLETLSRDYGLKFKQVNKTIHVSQKEKETQEIVAGIKVTGTVYDDQDFPIPGANILIKGTSTGTITDLDGKFILEDVPADGVLIVRFVGFEPMEVPVNGRSIIEVKLSQNTMGLDEVVVVGYGMQKKATLVGAVNSIDTKDLLQSPTANLGNALGGRLPGLIVQQRGGAPGSDAPTIRIRGVGTTNNADPLVLVDGVERPFNQIDPNEVETISILKDASATAVFGVRGANGVILITTKRGEVGKPQVTATFNQATQSPTQLPDYLDSYNTAMLMNEGLRNEGQDPLFSDEELEKFRTGSDPYLYPNTDWYDAVLNNSAPQSQANVKISGGTKTARYFVSGSYLTQRGLYKDAKTPDYDATDRFQRYNFRSNLDFDVTKDFTASVNLAGRREVRNSPGIGLGTIFSSIARLKPYESSVYNPDGSLSASNVGANPVGQVTQSGYNRQYLNTFELTVKLNHKLDFITEGLSARAMGAYDNIYRYNESWTKSFQEVRYSLDEDGNPVYIPKTGVETPLSFGSGWGDNSRRFYTEFAIDYARTFEEDHAVSALALFNTDRTWGNANWPASKLGLVGRVTYGFKDKYLAEFNMGYNGTDNFAPGLRFGFFPSASAGWVISEESWIKDSAPWVSFLKLRGSYGLVGNSGIGGRRWLYFPDKYGSVDGYPFGENPNNTGGLGETELGNPMVTWEKAKKSNIGFEAFFNEDKFGIVFDLFRESRNDILMTRRDVSGILGQSALPPVNIGVMENKGFEIELSHRNRLSGDFGYFVTGNMSYARNIRSNLTEPTPEYPWMSEEGTPLGQVFGYQNLGFFDSQEEIDNWADQSSFGMVLPGDIKYKDLNGDGVINTEDMSPIGFPLFPEVIYGATIGFDYKGFDFSMLFQGAANGSSYFLQEAGWEFFNSAKAMSHHLGRWTPETKDTATYPRISSASDGANNNFQTSDFWLKDASYLRLKNLEIGYTLPKSFLSKFNASNCRIYVNGTNLLTWDNVEWQDPEMRNNDGSRYFRGWQYPIMRVFNAGLSVTF
ncbi:SusC/RagA family TonB-linked outer membrane protein [Echinicola shivajiensis]|uniref:SusC/RagA family TonB-linked outer membrane protein n=1 Tax=Echinicola shivajiensis TaxID=1035916 RepID=UPI001BFC33C1|nr:TonB-dependent receptor [Echinicola shivajiensis]